MSSAAPTHRRLLYVVIGMLAFSTMFAIIGGLYQSIASGRERSAHPMPGRLIDVGGYRLHIDCVGQGSPPVILDSGLGDSYMSWRKVQPQIAQFAQTCSYDRAGLGYSDSSPQPRTSKAFAEELHTLLHNTQISPPYILVGHSMAGFNVRIFADLYRNEVAGVVLVDSSHPEQRKRFSPAVNDMDATWLREQEFMEFAMLFGVPRVLGFCGHDAEVRAAECNFHSLHESVAELKSIPGSSVQTANAGSLGAIPLTVLSQDPNTPQYDLPDDLVKPTNSAWQEMQKELAALSSQGTEVIAKNSGHYIQLDRPDVVIAAVHNLIDRLRSEQSDAQLKR